jgi:hypothetical protein
VDRVSLVAFAFVAAGLCGCAQPQKVWEKIGSTPNDFSQARYACLQQSQQPTSGAYINRYGGYASSNIITNGGLFDACMNARGWTLTEKTSPAGSTPYSDALQALKAEGDALCDREDLQPFYKKSPCKASEPTLEQLADRSKITPVEKVALTKVRAAIRELNKKYEETNRQYNPQTGYALAENIAKGTATGEKIALEFYEGRITRGEFNKRRKEAVLQYQAQAEKIVHGGS